MKLALFNYLKQLFILLVIGALSGLIVGLYQLGIQNIVKVSTFMYSSKDIFVLFILIFLVSFCMVFNNILILKDAAIDGSGIPSMKLARRQNKPISFVKDIPCQILNSYASTFTGFPLGSEGPSVVLASKISYGVNKLFRNENKTLDELAEGVGFGSAFLSPLAGFCYNIEESLESKLTFRKIIRAIIMMLSAFIITSLINKNHLLSITSFEKLSLNDSYIYVFILVINIVVSFIFIKIMLVLRAFFTKYNKNKFIKFRSIPLYIITFILNIFLLDLMQSGGKLISSIATNHTLYIVILILAFRFLLTAISGSGDITGGLVVPIMAIGAINGEIVSIISANLFGFNLDNSQLICLMSALMMFAMTIQTPFTAISLLFSTIFTFIQDITLALSIIPFFTLAIFFGYIVMSRLLKQKSLYEGMIEVSLKYQSK